jgi:Zn ribbon nucleic-acid-binding protein
MRNAMTNHDDDNLVSPDSACPKCGQRDMDLLVWIDDDIVHCAICGTEYDPLKHPSQNGGSHDRT